MSLDLRAEVCPGVSPVRGWERKGTSHARGQPRAQMELADGWKVLSAAGPGLVFKCELRLRDPRFPSSLTVHHSSGASSAKALNMVLNILFNYIFTNPTKCHWGPFMADEKNGARR